MAYRGLVVCLGLAVSQAQVACPGPEAFRLEAYRERVFRMEPELCQEPRLCPGPR